MAFPGNNYAPPGVYTRTLYENPLQGAIDALKIPVFIGEGNEFLVERNLEVVRGSSADVDQRVPSEDETGRAVVSVSASGAVTLGAWTGSLNKFQVQHYPIVDGSGSGTVTNNRADVSATINNNPIVVKSVDGARGLVELATTPKASDIVRCTYFFKRTDTRFTDNLSDQVTSTPAFVRAVKGLADVNAEDNQGATLYLHGDLTNNQGEVTVAANNVLDLIVDGVALSITITPGAAYTLAQVANIIAAKGGSSSLTATTFINNFGHSALRLGADEDIQVVGGSAVAELGLVAGTISNRRKTFYTFHGPIVDGSNGGVTTTDPSHVTVKVGNEQVIPVSVDGASRAVTLPFAPKAGAKVVVTYYANTWQDTYDILAKTNIVSISSCGDVPDQSAYTSNADFVLSNDKIYWGAAWSVGAGVNTSGKEFFDETQVTGLLVDNRSFMAACTPVAASNVSFQLPLDPTLGNGRDTKLGTSLFQSAANGRIDVPVNRPDVVNAYWGFDVQDALQRGRVDVVRVEGNVITLAETVPVGATVYATFFYNQLTDNEYTLTVVNPNVSGVGTYTISDGAGDPVFGASFNTGSKGAGLIGVSLAFPSGSELTPDLRFEGVSGDDFTGPVEEIVTVELAERNASPARFSVPGAGPYEFILGQSDNALVNFNGTNAGGSSAGVDLSNPLGISGWDGGFFASLVSDQIDYTGGSGSTVGVDYTLDTTETFTLFVDGVEIPVTVAAGSEKTVADIAAAINLAANGFQGVADDGGAATITLPTSVPNYDVPNYFVGWNVTIGNGADAVDRGTTLEITAYNSSTRVATVSANWSGGAAAEDDPFRLWNPDTIPVLKGATRFDGAVDLSNGFTDLRFVYTGVTSTVFNSGVLSISDQSYASLTDLVAAVQSVVDVAISGAGAAFAGLAVTVSADAEGRLQFALALPGVDASGYLTFIDNGIDPEDSFAVLAGLDVSTASAGGQATLCSASIARVYSVQIASNDTRPYDRLILRNRILPGGGASLAALDALEQCQLEVGAGSGLAKAGLSVGQTGEAGYRAVVQPATVVGRVGFGDGQDGDGQPQVMFYDGSGAQPANDEFVFILDGVSVKVIFGSSADGTATPLGPASGNSNGSILDQIMDALAAIPGAPFGDAGDVFDNLLVRQEGAGIRLTSAESDSTSLIEIGSSSANDALGFTDGLTAQRELVSVAKLVSALNGNRHSTFATMINNFNSSSNGYFTDDGMGFASVVTDSSSNEYLYLQSAPVDDTDLGSASTVTVSDALVSSIVTDSWLYYNTGVDALDGDGDVGEAAVQGFFVTSSNPDGSGSINTSALNDGEGQDGILGQTYRDAVTGLTFTLLPRGWHDNESGPWASYPTGGTATFRINVSKTFTTNANIPHNALPGLELKVANTYNMGVGDTAVVSTFERGGNEPSIGDVYYVSYTFQKQDFGTAFYTKLSSVEASYGAVSPDNPVSLAAYLAAINGAILFGVKQVGREEGSNFASLTSYRDAIEELEGVLPGQIKPDLILPLRGDSPELFQVLKRSNEIQSSLRYRRERTSIIGMSAGSEPKAASDLAGSLVSDRMRLVYPDMATLNLTDAVGATKQYLVDGPMLASALTGSVVSPNLDVAVPWTGRLLVGFSGLARRLDAVEMNQVAQKGVTVLEDRPPAIRVRHGLTTDMTDILTKLPTIRLISDEVQRQARTVLEQFIGIKFLPGILTQIEGRMAMMLKRMQQQQIISAYTGVKAKVSADDPTVAEVEAFYSPVFPLLYIVVSFHLRSSL